MVPIIRSLSLISLGFFILCAASKPASADLVNVASSNAICSTLSSTIPCYTSVQKAIADAMAGTTNPPIDAIKIYPGTYPVNAAAIIRSITIGGTETSKVFLDGQGGTSILAINNPTSSVTIRNLTFVNAQVAITVTNTSTGAKIYNNIFEVGNTAIQTNNSASTDIMNNVFYRNTAGISCDTLNLAGIKNNVFVQTSGSTAISLGVDLSVIWNNIFNGGTIGPPVNVTPGTVGYQGNLQNVDPLFVDPDNANINNKDFHLSSSSSPCVDTGNASAGRDAVDDSPPDIGVYGGSNSDTIPNPVSILTTSATTTTPFEITLTWSANPAYTVKGYNVYYGYTSGVYKGNDAVVSGATVTSPIHAGDVTSLTLAGLSGASAVPAVPSLNQPAPQNGSLVLTWSTVSKATGYRIYYHEIDPTSGPTSVVPVIGNVGGYTLYGLTNGHTYAIQISAVNQAVYYLAVTAYDAKGESSGTVGIDHESNYSGEKAVSIGSPLESALSGEVTGIPEMIIPVPNLPNSGCFIATAAYGSYDAAPVRVLRNFRDRFLVRNAPGRAFIAWYYRNSPRIAASLNAHPALKPFVRIALEPLVAAAFLLTTLPARFLAVMFFLLSLAAVAGLRRLRRATIPRS